MEWKIECDHCGEFIQIQKNDPVICPKCASPDIETTEIKIKYKIVVNRYNSWEVMRFWR
jgi:Zn finger protein HypA/HybF involved in hydrogenase expression